MLDQAPAGHVIHAFQSGLDPDLTTVMANEIRSGVWDLIVGTSARARVSFLQELRPSLKLDDQPIAQRHAAVHS